MIDFMSSTKYPISNLYEYNSSIDISSLIELIVDDFGNNDYVNKKATCKALGDYIISSHAIFNKLDEVFNDKTVIEINNLGENTYPHHADMYFAVQSYFLSNPLTNTSMSIRDLKSNQTIRKDQLENYLHENALEIRSINNDLVYNQKVEGIGATLDPPIYDELTFRPLYAPSQGCKFRTTLYDGKLYSTNAISMPQDGSFVTIVGKVCVPISLRENTSKYYTPELKLWAGVFYVNNLIAITELHNIDSDGVAYFSFQIPTSKDDKNGGIQRIRVVVPFKPDDSETTLVVGRDLFKNIPTNSVAVFYYTKS